ncbi:hypothetical protein GW17_00025704 [Ensete ventricosum]|nr:hypothetical protein GW17_00025704 [Ensete ventricosum]
MKNPWNDIIPQPLHEFMSLTSVQAKLRASAPCSIFYVDSLYAASIPHQVPLKLLRSSIYIELMVAFAPTIPRVSPSFGDYHPLGLLRLTKQSVHCSAPANAFTRLRLFANTAPATPFKA